MSTLPYDPPPHCEQAHNLAVEKRIPARAASVIAATGHRAHNLAVEKRIAASLRSRPRASTTTPTLQHTAPTPQHAA
jgi:hypothetical protein